MTRDPFDEELDEHLRVRAIERYAKRRMQLRVHVAAYLGVQILLLTVWALTTPGGFPWFLIPLVGWGIGLAVHVVVARGDRPRDPRTGAVLDVD